MMFKTIKISTLVAFLAVAIALAGCDAGDSVGSDPPPLIPDQDGFYVYGTDTIAEDALDPEARMSRAVLDPSQGAEVENMEGVYGRFMYIGGNSTIHFEEVEDDESTVFGASGGGTREHGEEIADVGVNDVVIHGTLQANGPAIEIEEEGLYYVFANTLDEVFVVMPVRARMIGDATEQDWAEGTPLPMTSVSTEGAVFEREELPLSGHSGYRYLFNDGFHVYASPNIVTFSSLGVPDYGTAWDTGESDIGFHLDNIPHHEDGVFTVRLEFDASTGEWSETKTKTGELVADHSETSMGLFGNAFEVDGEEADWDVGYGLHEPNVDGNVFTWTWNSVDLIEEREFIFLEDGEWGGLQIDYTGASVEGEAAENDQIVDATTVGGEHHNFFVVEGGEYDVSLEIDAEAAVRTITIDPSE